MAGREQPGTRSVPLNENTAAALYAHLPFVPWQSRTNKAWLLSSGTLLLLLEIGKFLKVPFIIAVKNMKY